MKLVNIEPYKGKVIASHTYCGVNKLIEIDALEEISEQEIVKPYLDKIRAEIKEQKKERCFDDDDMFAYRTGLDDAILIIDKHKAESEE